MPTNYPQELAQARRNLRKGDKGEVRGNILPLKRGADGELSLAMPQMLRDAGVGLLDLLAGTRTGDVTPEATGLLFDIAGGGAAMTRPTAGLLAATAGGVPRQGVKSGAMKAVDLSSPGFRKTSVGDTEISYTVGKNGIVEINKIETPRDKRGGGSARAALDQFLAETDEAGVRVALSAEPMDKGVSKSGLERFYKGAGFAPNKGRNKDFETRAEFIRAAKQGRVR